MLPAGLEMIEPLVSTTGGTLLLYTSWEAAALPQVLFQHPRLLACPPAVELVQPGPFA